MRHQHYQTQDLFQLQTELVEAKVEMAVSQAINRVLDRIDGLEKKMHEEFNATNVRLSALDNRLIAVETKLGMVNETQRELRTRFVDYTFKAGWTFLSAVALSLGYAVLLHLHLLS